MAALLALAALLAVGGARAHPASLGLLELEQRSPTEVRGRWRVEQRTAPTLPGVVDGARLARLLPSAPAACSVAPAEPAGFALSCPSGVAGVPLGLPSAVLTGMPVVVRFRAGPAPARILVPDHGVVTLPAGERGAWPGEDPGSARAGASWVGAVGLGFRHAAGGADHALVMACLPLIAPGRRRLLVWVTAFTAGHGLSLVAAALGWARLPVAPVEVAIALSVLLVALRAARGGAAVGAAVPRAEAALAVAFGLFHGLGFAGALGALGPSEAEVLALLLPFHAGVELAQWAWVGAALGLLALAQRLGRGRAVGRGIATLAGSAAVFWLLERTLALG